MQAIRREVPAQTDGNWRKLLSSQAFWLALILLSSGLICLLAANWAQLGKWTRLIGLESLLVLTVGVAIWDSRRRGMGSNSVLGWLFLAAIGVGALFALVGQTYQSGAEGWQLFAWWTVLLLPWGLTLRRPGFWLFWLVLMNLALTLWLSAGHGFWWLTARLGSAGAWQVALPNLLCLALWYGCGARLGASGHAVPRVLTALALWPLAVDVGAGWLDHDGLQSALLLLTAIWALASGWLWRRASRATAPDLWVLAITALGVMGVSLAWVQSLLGLGEALEAMLSVWIIVIALESAWVAWYLLRLHERSHPAGEAAKRVPLSVQIILGIGAWLLMLFGLVLLLLLQLVQSEQGALVMGVLLMVVGAAVLRQQVGPASGRSGILVAQLGVAAAIAGLCLSGAALVLMLEMPWAAVGVGVLALLLHVATSGIVLRFLTAVVQAGALLLVLRWVFWSGLTGEDGGEVWEVLLERHGLLTPDVLVLAVLAVIGLLLAYGVRRRQGVLPAALAAVLVAQFAAFGLTSAPLSGLSMQYLLPSLIVLSYALLPAAVAWMAMRSLPAPVAPVWQLGLPLATLAVGLLTLSAPAVLLALAWIWLGIAVQRRWLRVFGTTMLLLGLCDYYYSLQVPLLDKAWLQMLGGVIALLIGLAVRPRVLQPAGATVAQASWRMSAGLVAGLVLVLAVANAGVWRDERILAQGKPLLLALAPVDPRALLQGDFMALSYAADQTLRQMRHDETPSGYAVLAAGTAQPAQILRLQPAAQPQADDEVVIPVRVTPWNSPSLAVTGAYFFAEGLEPYFSPASFGEFRVDDAGRAVLVQLRDAQMQPMSAARQRAEAAQGPGGASASPASAEPAGRSPVSPTPVDVNPVLVPSPEAGPQDLAAP